MTSAKNEVFIGLYHENYYLVGEGVTFFLVDGNEQTFG